VSVTVITGPPGAGKTTVAAAVARSSPFGVHLVADQCFHWIASGYVAPWRTDADRQNATVIGVIGVAAARYAEGGYDVIVDGIVGPWFLGRLQQAIGSAADTIRYVVLRPSRQIAQQRALGRAGPEDLIDPGPIGAMYDAFMDLGAFERYVVDSSDHELTVTVEIVRCGLDRGLFKLAANYDPF
jgi:hypothetical protein